MNITTKLQDLYRKADWFEDCGYWVQYRSTMREINDLERLREEEYRS